MSKPKSVTLFKFDYILKDINSEEFDLVGGIYSKTTYDEEGRTLSELKYEADGSIEQHYGYAYNEQGERIAERSWDESGNLIEDIEFDLDTDGKVQQAYKNYLDGSRDTISYTYDDRGNLLGKEVVTDEDELEMAETFAYEDDREVLHEMKDENDELVLRKETAYDEKGRVVEERTWSAETGSTLRTLTEYDDKGEISGVSSYNEDGEMLLRVSYKREGERITGVTEHSPDKKSVTTIEYDEKDNPVLQEEHNDRRELVSRIMRKFDDEGNVLESEVIIDSHGQGRNQHYILKYEYEFY